MNDLTKMSPVEAILWYVEHDRDVDAYQVESLVRLGVTDTDRILELAKTVELEDLEAVPGLDPTPENLRKLGIVGPVVMRDDPENVDEWVALAEHPYIKESYGDVGFEAFLAAGRGPTFARQVLDVLNRRDYNYYGFEALDLTLPYPQIADMIESGLNPKDIAKWKEAGFELPEAVRLREQGLNLEKISVLRGLGIDRADWARYSDVPVEWLKAERPEGWTLDLLAELAAAGWAKVDSLFTKPPRPWSYRAQYGPEMSVTPGQARRMVEAGMTVTDAREFHSEAMVEASGPHQPNGGYLRRQLLSSMVPHDGSVIDTFIDLWQAGVRTKHLSDYRRGGCSDFRQVLQAAQAGISGQRVKYLRTKYGRTGTFDRGAAWIETFDALLAAHQRDTENAAFESVVKNFETDSEESK